MMPASRHPSEKTFDAKFLQRDVLRRPQRRNRREQSQIDVALAEMHGKHRRHRQFGWRGVDGRPHSVIAEQSFMKCRRLGRAVSAASASTLRTK